MPISQPTAADVLHVDQLLDEREHLSKALQEKEHLIALLTSSNEALGHHVQHLKKLAKESHVRYEGELQQTVAALQEQYNAAMELLHVGSQVQSSAAAPGWPPDAVKSNVRGCNGQFNHAKPNGAGKPADDQCALLLGVDPGDFSPASAYGATVGLVTEPVAVLRDVLNLQSSRQCDRENVVPAPTNGSSLFASLTPTSQFESRLRNAYRSMLLQLQHRYSLDRERQEQVHKMQLQEQDERHRAELSQLRSAADEEVTTAARKAEQEAAGRRADVHRLETQLMEAQNSTHASQGQVSAARATLEALQAQLQLQRATHEAEIQHIQQGCISMPQHEEAIGRLKTEYEEALRQRERDFNALLTELTSLRRQLSSVAPSQSSGSSCARGPEGSVAAPRAPQLEAALALLRMPEKEPQRGGRSAGEGTAKVGSSEAEPAAAATGDTLEPAPPLLLPVDSTLACVGLSDKWPPQQQGRPHDHLSCADGGGKFGFGAAAEAARTAMAGSPDGSTSRHSHDDHDSCVLDVPDVTPQSRGPKQDAPPSVSSSRMSELINAVVHGNWQQVEAELDRAGSGGGDGGSRGQKSGDLGGGGAGLQVSRRVDGSGGGAADLRAIVREGQRNVREDQQAEKDGWKFFQQEHDSPSRGCRTQGKDHRCREGVALPNGPQSGSSVSASASDVTLGHWRRSSAGIDAQSKGGQRPAPPTAAWPEGMAPTERGERQPPARAGTSGIGEARQQGRGAAGHQSPRGAFAARSSSGNKAAAATQLRCLRCGFNDLISPGHCSFHPALLTEPGSLLYSPEWLACRAAGHKAEPGCPGCFLRKEHWYEPAFQQPSKQQPIARPGNEKPGGPPQGPQGQATQHNGQWRGGGPAHLAQGVGMGAVSPRQGRQGGAGQQSRGSEHQRSVVRWLDEEGIGGCPTPARHGLASQPSRRAGIKGAGAPKSPTVVAGGDRGSAIDGAVTPRGHGRGAIGGGCGRGGGAAGAQGRPDCSPSPRPRSKLPAPLRR